MVEDQRAIVRFVIVLGVEEEVELQVASCAQEVLPQFLPGRSIHLVSVLTEKLAGFLHSA